ncbi:MAG: two-component system, NtrC family, sensor kinase, partial [Solirubrobacteraceae bacterium]|nr:two-component system, NtrC family, sensor kinase [Solirubrobacteraceae bacterium]
MRRVLSGLAASRVVSRAAIGGMLLAIVALAALAFWAHIVAQGHSDALSRAGAQTSGHLRATQALGQIDKYSDKLEGGIDPQIVADVRSAQHVLGDSLARMQRESVVEWERRLARDAEPDLRRLTPAVDAFLGAVRARDANAQVVAETNMEAILDRMQLSFNDIRRDPSRLLQERTAQVASSDHATHRAAMVLLPVALLFGALCIWLLTTSRKRGQAERERMEAELRVAHRLEAVGHLAAGVAHEINTPMQFVGDSVRFVSGAYDDLRELGSDYKAICADAAVGHDDAPAIRARIQAAEDRADLEYLDERVPAAFERTLEGVARVATIVAAMKTFSRPNQLEHTHADINDALRSTLVVAQSEYKYVADVETEFGEIPPVMCNVNELNQVFLNLIVNAAHAIGETVGPGDRGAIRVTTAHEDDTALITISDSGPGIPDEIRERIFDPFFTTKDVGKGTG